MEPTEEQNLENIKRCPRFDGCNIPKCPLDYWMSERVELSEDERCILRGKQRSKRVKGIRSAKMGIISKFVCKKNKEL